MAPPPLSVSPRCLEYHSRIWSRLADLKKMPPIPRMRPRCSILTGGLDCSDCGDCTCRPPVKAAEMSKSEPSAMVLQGGPCMRGLYTGCDSGGAGDKSLTNGFYRCGYILWTRRMYAPRGQRTTTDVND